VGSILVGVHGDYTPDHCSADLRRLGLDRQDHHRRSTLFAARETA
jgi:hypothetical protein